MEHSIWWYIAWVASFYTLIGVGLTIQAVRDPVGRKKMKEYNIRWFELLLSVFISPIVYICMKPWRHRG